MRTLTVLTALSLSLFAGCSSPPAVNSPEGDVAMAASQVVRAIPNVPSADADALRDGDTAFALDFYQRLRANPAANGKNLFFSPHSISLALAMAYAGARGETATQMAKALHFTLPQERLHPAINALDLALSSRGVGAKGNDGKAFRLRVTNSIWGSPDTTFAPSYLDTLGQNYGAGIRLTDFAANPEAARATINSWVDKETEERIKELLAPGTIEARTRTVLVNAVYFNAAWATPFEKAMTRAGTFHGAGGDSAAQLMTQGGTMPYMQGDGFQAVSLPYDGNELSFVAVMPEQFGAFETAFSADQAKTIASSLSPVAVQLKLPKFTIKGASFSLKSALAAGGMTDAFDPAKSDFSGMAPSEKLFVSDVVHQAFVAVDEAGTEAAAATAVVLAGRGAPSKVVALTIDKPFLFFVRDNATGAILFLGRVLSV